MKYYLHHIRDFNNATRHLSRIERSLYRDMIELYYDSELPLPKDVAALCRKVVARSEEEKAAVLALLDEFFTDTPDGWRNERCDEQIAAASVKMEDEEARQENERERQRRHRARRKELFAQLREFNEVPPYDTKTEALQSLLETHLSRVTSQNRTTDATANQYPIPNTQDIKTNVPTPAAETVLELSQDDLDAIEKALPAEVAAAQAMQAAAKPRRHHGTEEDHKAARWIFERVHKLDATAKTPNWDGWANDVRLMREIDGRSHADICQLFDWANRDPFWGPNILSPAKLREQWGKLTARMAAPVRGKAPTDDLKFRPNGSDYSSSRAAMEQSMAQHGVSMDQLDDVDF